MKLQLLILTMPTRTAFLKNLLDHLHPQIEKYPRDVGIAIQLCDPSRTLGENRNQLVQEATAEYVAHCDDDDLLADDYCDSILPLLDRDYVGFDVQCYIDGKPLEKITHHSLQYTGWYQTPEGYMRDISHINPMRRDLAMLEPFEGGHGEDHRWADRMRARGVVRTEHYVPRVLYHYFFRSNKNRANPCPKCGSASTVRVEMGSMCNSCGATFNPHPEQKSCLWE